MAATPPNPFDPQEVQKYLDRKAADEVTKSRRAEALAEADNDPAVESSNPAEVMGRADLMGADTPTDEANEMVNYWKAQGPEVFTEAMEAIIGAIMSEAAELGDDRTVDRLDKDAVLVHARLGKSIKDAGEKMYYAGRTALWELVGRRVGKHATPSGETFRFKSGPQTTTRVDRKRLEAEFPEVYAEVVKTTHRDTDKPGNLYL